MKLTAVDSKTLSAVGYSERKKTLLLAFCNGSLYRYSDVPADIYYGLMNAESMGAYFNEHVRDCYPYVCLRSSSRSASA